MQVNRRLYRCSHDRLIAGVASGVAERFDVDPTIVRVLWVLSVFFGGLGLFAYVVMAIIVPLEPEAAPAAQTPAGDPTDEAAAPAQAGVHSHGAGWQSAPATHPHGTRGNGRVVTFFGIALILFGALALVDAIVPAWADTGRFLWPAFIVGIGVLLVASALRREPTEL
jgi:phage shock protein C